MTSPEGGFYSALDAETEGEEGAYYVWSREQVQQALGEGEAAEAFAQVYGLKREPNFEKDRYVLLEPRSRADQARTLKTTPEALEATPRPAPRQAPGRPRRPPRPLARRQGAHLVERPDDRGLRRRLPPAEGRRPSPGRREGRRLPADQAPDPRRPPAPDLSRRDGQAAGLPGGLRLPRARPAPAPRRHRRPEAAGAGPRADRPHDRRLRRHRAGGLLLHRRRPREPARPPQGPVRQRPPQRQQRRHPEPRRARGRDGRAELPRPRRQGPRRLQPGHGAEPRRPPPDARRPRGIPRRPTRRRRGPAHEAPEPARSRKS